MRKPLQFTCLTCNKSFLSSKRPAQYCSPACWYQVIRQIAPIACVDCGRECMELGKVRSKGRPFRCPDCRQERQRTGWTPSAYTRKTIAPFSADDHRWDLVRKQGECWVWLGRKRKRGYGAIGRRAAHRVSYEAHCGPIPDGMCVCHRCDNPSCVRPDHLFIGTRTENIKDRDQKGRAAKGEQHGMAKMTAADVMALREEAARSGRVAAYDLAASRGIKKIAAADAISGRTWKHLKP
jgi:hypothetical protein